MVALLTSLIEPQNPVTILVGLSAFATVMLAVPLLQGDRLASRMKQVASERERLRAQARAAATASEGRLRERSRGRWPRSSSSWTFGSCLRPRLARALAPGAACSERHLVVHSRGPADHALCAFVFIYSSTFADRIPASMRLVTTMTGLDCRLLPAQRLAQELHPAPPGIDQARLVRRARPAADLRRIGHGDRARHGASPRRLAASRCPLLEEMTLTNAELSFSAIAAAPMKISASAIALATVKSVVTSLIQSERYGTPLGTALRVCLRRTATPACRKPRSAPRRSHPLTVPMVLFFLPVIFIVLLGPAGIQVFGK